MAPYKTDLARLTKLAAYSLRRWNGAMILTHRVATTDQQIVRSERWFAAVERCNRLVRIAQFERDVMAMLT